MVEAVDGYFEGYEEALLHVRTLFSGLDLQPCKPFMMVDDSRLIDLSEGEHTARTSRGILGIEADQVEEGDVNVVEPRAESS